MNQKQLTDEQLNQPVLFKDLAEIFKKHIQDEVETLKKVDESTDQIINSVVDSFLMHIKLAEYKHSRLELYLFNVFSSLNHLDKQKLQENYKNWCAEFDKANQKILNDIYSKGQKKTENKEEQLEGQESLFNNEGDNQSN